MRWEVGIVIYVCFFEGWILYVWYDFWYELEGIVLLSWYFFYMVKWFIDCIVFFFRSLIESKIFCFFENVFWKLFYVLYVKVVKLVLFSGVEIIDNRIIYLVLNDFSKNEKWEE